MSRADLFLWNLLGNRRERRMGPREFDKAVKKYAVDNKINPAAFADACIKNDHVTTENNEVVIFK